MTKPSNTLAETTASLPTIAWLAPVHARSLPRGYDVHRFADSDAFLLNADAFDFDLYVIDTRQKGVGAMDLVRLVRRHGPAGIIVVEPAPQRQFCMALDSGADMVLAANAPREHLESALAALKRRLAMGASAPAGQWRLSRRAAELWAPSGARAALSESDVKVLGCFADAAGRPVDRDTLLCSLWGKTATGMDNALQATIYRLRKRVEAAISDTLPIRSVARTGYEFRGRIESD